MKVLFVSRSTTGKAHPFIKEQADVLNQKFGVGIEYFFVEKGGVNGYLQSIVRLRKYLKSNPVDIIHVHYGLSALPVVIARLLQLHQKKIVVTYHGCDINKTSERYFSLIASKFASFNILVSPQMTKFFKENYAVIPCGIDTNINTNFREMVRMEKGWGPNDFVVLFCSNFDREVKDPGFAKATMRRFSEMTDKKIHFLELKGYNRSQLTQLMQAADVMLMCSISEGSPQIIKESILNSLPVISNDVGEVKAICQGADNCFIVEKKIDAYVKILEHISSHPCRINNREFILSQYDNNLIAKKIFKIYQSV